MSYNEFTYDLQPMELPNIVFANMLGADQKPTICHPFMAPLVMRLAKARPNWTLVGTDRSMIRNDLHYAIKFSIMEHGEELGTVNKSYRSNGSDVYEIENHRIRAKRQRGNATFTKDTSKAFKLITTTFGGLTTAEQMERARDHVHSIVSNQFSDKLYKANRAKDALREATLAFAMDHWDEFKVKASMMKADSTMVDTLHDKLEDYSNIATVSTAWQNGKGTLVVLRGSEYILRNAGEVVVKAHGDLTGNLKRGIGLLKLAEPNQTIPGVGIKASDTEMFIVDGTE